MSQFGGGRLGGVSLQAGGMVPQDLRALPQGPIKNLILRVLLSVKSSGSAFAGVVSTDSSAASEGTDDMDLLLNAVLTTIALYFDEEHYVGTLTPAQWRTVLGLLNQKDFAGTLKNAFSVPSSVSSATAFQVAIIVPISLERYFKDGMLFQNGSRRLSGGRVEWTAGASLTPSVTLANGTAAVSALSVSIEAETGAGTEDDVGMTWRVLRKANLPTVSKLEDDVLRIGIMDVTPVASSAVSAFNFGDYSLWAPVTFGARYQAERLNPSGFDITARCTPLLWLDKEMGILDFNAHLGKSLQLDAVSGVSSMTIYDVQAIPATPNAVQRVSQRVSAGGPVTIQHPTPPSLPPGSSVPAQLVHLLPQRILPGGTPPQGKGSAVHAANPAAAAQNTMQHQATAGKVRGLVRAFGRK